MSRSFYYGNDAQLLSGSSNFSSLITANPTSYGLVAAQATSYGTLHSAFASALTLWENPPTRTKGALENKNTAREALIAKAKQLVAIIQATPTVTNGQRGDLGIAIRSTPTPLDSLGQATDFGASLDATGALNLKWKCVSPRGTGMTYQIWRLNSPDAEWEYLGGTGEKKWLDDTLPAGSSRITYQIQATRSTAKGPWAAFNVTIGVGGGSSALKTTITQGKAVKIAA